MATLVLTASFANAAVGDFELSVRNITQPASNRLEFDVYLLDTDPGQTFELASCQFGFLINSLIYNGGTITVTINNTGTGLNLSQQFTAAPSVVSSLTGYPGQTLIRLAAGSPVSAGSGTVISTVSPGTLLTHFIITSTVDFAASSTPNITFTANTATAPLYPTRVAAFILSTSTQLPVTPGTNAIVTSNPVLNPPAPIAYSVTGGGSFCVGGSGVAVGLADSEAGVTYTLIRGGTVEVTPTVSGTGSAISFGLQTVGGTYTVEGSNAGGTTLMTGSAIVTVDPLPAQPGAFTASTATVCQGTTNVVYTVPNDPTVSYNWSYTGGTGATISGSSNSITVSYSASATSGTLSVTATNGCGTGTARTLPIAVNPLPAQPGAFTTSTATVCRGTSNVAYTVPNDATVSYNWTYSGSGATITGSSNSITVNYSASATSGTLSVTATNGCGNSTARTLAVTVNTLPSVDAGTDVTIAFGTSTALNATVTGTGPFTYSWTPAAQLVNATVVDPTTVNLNSTTTFTLVATSTSTTCSASDQVTVNVSGGALSATATATPGTVCAGSAVVLSAGATGGSGTYTYAWTSVPAGFTSSLASPIVNPTVNITYYVTVNDGFNTANSNVAVTVNPLPAQPGAFTASTTTVCRGTSNVAYTVPNDATVSYIWAYSGSGATITGTTNSVTVSYSASATSGTLSVTATNTCGTSTARTLAVTVNTLPTAPVIGTITQPGCFTSTGSIPLSGLPAIGDWVLTRTPGGTTTGSGTTTTISNVLPGTYTFTVTNSAGCVSPSSASALVDIQPSIPSSPAVGTVTPPTCILASGSVQLTGLPAGDWTLTRYPGGTVSPGSGSTIVISNLPAGTYNYTVTSSAGCISSLSANVIIPAQPVTPAAPVAGTPTQPTCSVATGSVLLSGLPSGNWTINPGSVTGSSSTATISGLTAGSYNFTVTNSAGCTSPSVNVVINAQPATPAAPVTGTVTQPSCSVATGSVPLTGLPSGNWTLTRNPGATTTSGSGTTTNINGLTQGTWTFTVTNLSGCTSVSSTGVTINAQPASPVAPVQTVNCDLGFGNAVVTVTSPTGAGLEYSIDGGAFQTVTAFNGVDNGTHYIIVRNAAGCTTRGTDFSVSCGCVNPPALSLSSISGSTCGVTPVTVSGNTFGGSATAVTITENGFGSLNIPSASASPFAFTYTPTASDAGRTVVVTVTTNNPLGVPCAAASATYTLTVNTNPAAPTIGTRTQPTCAVPTGSVILNGLPATGTWTLTQTPGGESAGTGTSTTVTSLASGTYTFTVTSATGCISPASASAVINAQPATPSAPVVGTVTQPTCLLSTGSVALSGLPATGSWTVTRTPGGITNNGTGATTVISSVPAGTYQFTVTVSGCISPASGDAVINPQPVTPPAPSVGLLTPPTCSLATGSVEILGLPSSGEWTLIRYTGAIPTTGTGTSTLISGLATGTYNFTVTNSAGCVSALSANVVIPAQPATPAAPVVGTITQPTLLVPTGSVVLSGLPASGSWILTRDPGTVTSTGSGTTTTVVGLTSGTYNFSVTNTAGCLSAQSADAVINPSPGAPVVVITNPAPVCFPATVDITVAAVTAGSAPDLTFTYWGDPGAIVAYTTPRAATNGTYFIKGTTTGGFFTIKPVVVTVVSPPVADAGPDQILDYTFSSTLAALPVENGTGEWTLVSGSGDVFNADDPASEVIGLTVGDNVFRWTVTNSVCPSASDDVTLVVNDLLVPTLITPNLDGRNDNFVIMGLESLGSTSLVIFDRRGMKMFENSDYDNLWDGVDYNSNPLPDDTYFYVLRFANGASLSGYIVIRR